MNLIKANKSQLTRPHPWPSVCRPSAVRIGLQSADSDPRPIQVRVRDPGQKICAPALPWSWQPLADQADICIEEGNNRKAKWHMRGLPPMVSLGVGWSFGGPISGRGALSAAPAGSPAVNCFQYHNRPIPWPVVQNTRPRWPSPRSKVAMA